MKNEVQTAYAHWAAQYDTNANATRDLEAATLRNILADLSGGRCLEIGCGTGKNTEWLAERCREVLAVDFSAEMQALARQKVTAPHVSFALADITRPWNFATGTYDLIVTSLVLEHIKQLDDFFGRAAQVLAPQGRLYISELHPYKQYAGSQARYEADGQTHLVPAYAHHLSDYTGAARRQGLAIKSLTEQFDESEKRIGLPRLLTLVFGN